MKHRVFSLLLTISLLLLSISFVPSSPAFSKFSTPSIQPQIHQLGPLSVVTHALAADPETLDPALTTSSDAHIVLSQIYDTLTNTTEEGNLVEPGLAETWSVSPDGLTWTFNLRANVLFHDGTPVNANSVLYNFQRWWDPAHPFHQAGFDYFNALFYGPKGDPASLIHSLASDGYLKFQIVLTQPYSPLPAMLTNPSFSIASPVRIAAGTLAEQPVGSGPFRFASRVPGSQIVLDPNPPYWGGQPHLNGLVFRIIPLSIDRFHELEAGGVDSAALEWSEVPNVQANANLKTYWNLPSSTAYLGINRAHTPLNNPLVVQAIAHAIHKPSILADNYNTVVPGAVQAGQLLPPDFWGRDSALADYTYDPTEAQDLLTQAGYPAGFTINLSVMPIPRPYIPNPNGVALSIQADLAAVGITANLVAISEWSAYLNHVYNGSADLFLLGWGADHPHPDNFYSPLLCDGSPRFGPSDTMLCNLLDSARAETNLHTLDLLYKSAGQRVHDTLPLIPIAHGRTAFGAHVNASGFQPTLLGYTDFEEVFYATSAAAASNVLGAKLEDTDADGDKTTVDIPAGAVSQETTFRFSLTESDRAGSAHLGVSGFVVSAERDGQPLPNLELAAPLQVTIEYSDVDLHGLSEDSLSVYYWDGDSWSSEGIQILSHDPLTNVIVVSIAHLSEFMLAVDQLTSYLPLTIRP